jgi:hypothetical protein
MHTSSFKDLSGAFSSIGQCESHNLIIFRKFDLPKLSATYFILVHRLRGTNIVEDNQWPVDTAHGVVANSRRN